MICEMQISTPIDAESGSTPSRISPTDATGEKKGFPQEALLVHGADAQICTESATSRNCGIWSKFM
jgi:hypothetical protein